MYTDGASRGNPGPSAIGASLQSADGHEIDSLSQVIEDGTNNVAEYRAALAGLERAALHTNGVVELRTDSELVVKQMNGHYAAKKPELRALRVRLVKAAEAFSAVRFVHVGREHDGQQRADALGNAALAAAGHPKAEWPSKDHR